MTTYRGRNGNDILLDYLGADILYGGAGDDYIFGNASVGYGRDTFGPLSRP